MTFIKHSNFLSGRAAQRSYKPRAPERGRK
jgi:hypothetical protein